MVDAETHKLIKEMLAIQRQRNALSKLGRGSNKFTASTLPWSVQMDLHEGVKALDREIERLAAAVAERQKEGAMIAQNDGQAIAERGAPAYWQKRTRSKRRVCRSPVSRSSPGAAGQP